MTNPEGTNPDAGGVPIGGGDMIGAIIGAGAQLYDSYQNRKASKQNTQMTIAANKAEAELAYQRQIEMWNMQNAYNSPQAQMQRFIAAGLNPHLIYGQGNSGNASSFPQYQPPNVQYKYAAPQYGAAIQSILPTLMSVGTWLQNMRLGEARYEQMQTSTDRVKQLVDYLYEANPKLLQQMDNKLSLFPYQKDSLRFANQRALVTVSDLEQDYRYKYGDELFRELSRIPETPSQSEIGGVKKLQFLQELSKTKLAEARASWSEFDITDPQALMQLVLSGVMGLAGSTLKLSTFKRPGTKVTHELENRMRNRTTIRRRTYQR